MSSGKRSRPAHSGARVVILVAWAGKRFAGKRKFVIPDREAMNRTF